MLAKGLASAPRRRKIEFDPAKAVQVVVNTFAGSGSGREFSVGNRAYA
jgi:hypothetical protein